MRETQVRDIKENENVNKHSHQNFKVNIRIIL